MVGTPIPGLHGTRMHATAVELYHIHHGDGAGACARCGQRGPCRVRAHAASVIEAAGEDPRWYDERQSPHAPVPGQPGPDQQPTTQLDFEQRHPDHYGYRVGGRDVRDIPAGFLYSREP